MGDHRSIQPQRREVEPWRQAAYEAGRRLSQEVEVVVDRHYHAEYVRAPDGSIWEHFTEVENTVTYRWEL